MGRKTEETGNTFDNSEAFLVYSGNKTSKEQMQAQKGSATYLGHAFFLVSKADGKLSQPTTQPIPEAKLTVNFDDKTIKGDLKEHKVKLGYGGKNAY